MVPAEQQRDRGAQQPALQRRPARPRDARRAPGAGQQQQLEAEDHGRDPAQRRQVQVRRDPVEQRRGEQLAAHAVGAQEGERDPQARGEHEVDQRRRHVGCDEVPAPREAEHAPEVPELDQRAGQHDHRRPGHADPVPLLEMEGHAGPADQVQAALQQGEAARARRHAQGHGHQAQQHAHDQRGDEAQRDEVRQRQHLGRVEELQQQAGAQRHPRRGPEQAEQRGEDEGLLRRRLAAGVAARRARPVRERTLRRAGRARPAIVPARVAGRGNQKPRRRPTTAEVSSSTGSCRMSVVTGSG